MPVILSVILSDQQSEIHTYIHYIIDTSFSIMFDTERFQILTFHKLQPAEFSLKRKRLKQLLGHQMF